MPPPFGNAATSANQQILCKLSNQDISASHTEGSSMHNTLAVENRKWRVKKKRSRSALLQLFAESGNLKSAPSDTFSTPLQATARRDTTWRENMPLHHNIPEQNPFTRVTEVHQYGHTITMGNASLVQIGNGSGASNGVNMYGQQTPFYPPSGAFPGDFTPPGTPGWFGYPQAPGAFYPQYSNQFGSNFNGAGQDHQGRRYVPSNQLTKGQYYAAPITYSTTAGGHGGRYGYGFNAGHIHGQWPGHTLATHTTMARGIHYLSPQSTPIQTPPYSPVGRSTTEGHGEIFNKRTKQSPLASYQPPPRTENVPTSTNYVTHNVTAEADGSAQNGLIVDYDVALDISHHTGEIKNIATVPTETASNNTSSVSDSTTSKVGVNAHHEQAAILVAAVDTRQSICVNKDISPMSIELTGLLPKTEDLMVVKVPGNGSCLFHSVQVAAGEKFQVQQLRQMVAEAVVRDAGVHFNGMPLGEWIHSETEMTPQAYAKAISANAWGGQIELHLLAQELKTPIQVYTESTMDAHAYQHSFSPTGLNAQGAESEPIRVLLNKEHYDALVRPGRIKHNQVKLIPTMQQEKEFNTSQETINDGWKGTKLQPKNRTKMQRAGVIRAPRQHKTQSLWTALSVEPTSDEDDNGMRIANEDASGSLDLAPQLGRDAIGLTILVDGVQRMMKTRLKPRRRTTKPQAGREGGRVDKWILDLRRWNERKEKVMQTIVETKAAQEQSIVDLIGGDANTRARTRRILIHLLSEGVATTIGTETFGLRSFALTNGRISADRNGANSTPPHNTGLELHKDLTTTNCLPSPSRNTISLPESNMRATMPDGTAHYSSTSPISQTTDQVQPTSIVPQAKEIRTPQKTNDAWVERTVVPKITQQRETQPDWTIVQIAPPSDGDNRSRASDNAGTSSPLHHTAQLDRVATGRITLADGAQRMIPRIYQAHMECTGPEPIRVTQGKNNLGQLNSLMHQGKEIKMYQETIDNGCTGATPKSNDTGGGTEGSLSTLVTEEVINKIQIIADTVSNNVWLTITLAILTAARAEQTISKEHFWTKVDEVCRPLLGAGPKQILNEGNCLYIAAIMASTIYDQNDLDQRARELKKEAGQHFKQILQNLNAPERGVDTGRFTVRRDSLLGQLLHALTPAELNEYASHMNENPTLPAGPLDISILSHLMGREIQVYRWIDRPQGWESAPVLAKCHETLSGSVLTLQLLFDQDHFTPLPPVLPPGTIHHIATSPGALDILGTGGMKTMMLDKIKRLMINLNREDRTQNDHWSITFTQASTQESVGLMELRQMSRVNKQWHNAAGLAIKHLHALTFQSTSPLTAGNTLRLDAFIPIAISACKSKNLRTISLRGCEIRDNTIMETIALDIRLKHPNVTRIDMVGCPDSVILPVLTMLSQEAFQGKVRQIVPPHMRNASGLLRSLALSSPTTVDSLLAALTLENLPQVILDTAYIPSPTALCVHSRISAPNVALLLGVLWGSPNSGHGVKAFSPRLPTYNKRPRLIEAVLHGDNEVIKVLLEAKGRVDLGCVDGTTPLLLAAICNRSDIALTLTHNQANTFATRYDNLGLMSIAISKGNAKLLRLAINSLDPRFLDVALLEGTSSNPRLATLVRDGHLDPIDHLEMPDMMRQCCVNPTTLEHWLRSHTAKVAQLGPIEINLWDQASNYILGVLGSLLATYSLSGTCSKQLEDVRGCLWDHKDFFDLQDDAQTLESRGLHQHLVQLMAQSNRTGGQPEWATGKITITPTHPLGIQEHWQIHAQATTGFCFASDQLIAWRELEGMVVTDVRSGFCLRRISNKLSINSHLGPSVLAFASADSGDNRLLISINGFSNDITVLDWRDGNSTNTPGFTTGVQIQILKHHKAPVTSIAVSGNNTILVSGSEDCEIIIWRIPFDDFTKTSYPGQDLKGAPKWAQRPASVLEKIKWPIVGTLKGHAVGVVTVAISYDATRVVSGSMDGSIRLWDTKTCMCLGVMSGTNPQGHLELVLCPKIKRMVPKEFLSPRTITSVAISHDGSRLVGTLSDTGSGLTMAESDFAVLTWAAQENPTQPMSIKHVPLHGHTDLVTTACFHPHDSNNIISGSRDGLIMIWNISDRWSSTTCLAKIHIPGIFLSGAPILRVLYSPNAKAFIAYGSDSTAHLCVTPQLPFLVHHPRHLVEGVTGLQLSPSGMFIASSGRDCIHVWNTHTYACSCSLIFCEIDDQPVNKGWAPFASAFSTDEQFLAAGGEQGRILVWDLLKGSVSQRKNLLIRGKVPSWKGSPFGPCSKVVALAFSPNNKMIIAGARSGTQGTIFHLWDVYHGTLTKSVPLPQQGLPLGSLSFHLFFPSQDTITLWLRERPQKGPDNPLHAFPEPIRHHTTWVRDTATTGGTQSFRISHDQQCPSLVPPDDLSGIGTDNRLLFVGRNGQTTAFFRNRLRITAGQRRDSHIVIGDAGGNVTFLSLNGEGATWPTVQVSVRPSAGSPLCHHKEFPLLVNIRLTSTVRDLKLAIINQLQLDLPIEIIHSWQLWYRNRSMEDHKSLAAHRLNILKDRSIELGCKPLGGMPLNSSTNRNKQPHRGNLALFEEVSRQQANCEEERKRERAPIEGAALGPEALRERQRELTEEGTRNEHAAQTRLKQENMRLMTAKEIKEEIATTLQPLEAFNEEEKQRFNRMVNIASDLMRTIPGGPPEHRVHAFIRWMLAKTHARCAAGQTLSTELTQSFLMQEGNRTSVTILLRSRMENYADTVSPLRCPTNIEVKSYFESLADTTSVSALPQDEVDKRRQGTDFLITLGRARHGLTELTAHAQLNLHGWYFDNVAEPPNTERLCLLPTNQEGNQSKFHSWVAGLRASHLGCLDTRIEQALLIGILPSWNRELSHYASNIQGLRLEYRRYVSSNSGRTCIKPSAIHFGVKSSQAPQIYIYIGKGHQTPDQKPVTEIIQDILTRKVTLQMNMVADKDRDPRNLITFSIYPRNDRPATGIEEARGRARDRLRQENQTLREETSKIENIGISLSHDRGDYTVEQARDTIRSICQDIINPARSHTSQQLGELILTILKKHTPDVLSEQQDWKEGLEPVEYVITKASGIPNFKNFFAADEYRKFPIAQKTATHLQLIRKYLSERGILTETLEIIHEERRNNTPDDTFIAIFTADIWKTITSPRDQGEPILLSIPGSIKKRLKGVITEPFRISGNISKQAPDFTFTPMEDDQADAQEKDPTILQILQGGDVIFAPAYSTQHQTIGRNTAWTDIPHILEWNSFQINSITGLQRPATALGTLHDLQDKGEATLLARHQGHNVWIFTTYLDVILTLSPVVLDDLDPTRPRDTNRHLLLGFIRESIKKGLLLQSIRGLWVENSPFDHATAGLHALDSTKEPFLKRDPVALPLAITTILGVPKSLGQGLSNLTEQVVADMVTEGSLEAVGKKGHTLLIQKDSDLKPAILRTDAVRVGFQYNSAMAVLEEEIAGALETALSRVFTEGWGLLLLSVNNDLEFPYFESNDFEPQLQSLDPLHITNSGSHILSQGTWIVSSSAFKKLKQRKGILPFPLASPKGILWLCPGLQDPPNDTVHRTLAQLLGPDNGTHAFVTSLCERDTFESGTDLLAVLQNVRQQAILKMLRQATANRPLLIPSHIITMVDGKRKAILTPLPHGHQVHQGWIPRIDMIADNTEILQAAISLPKNDPNGIAAHLVEKYGILLTRHDHLEPFSLSDVLSALPEALIKEPVSIATLGGDMEYAMNFDEDQGEGNGGPSQTPT